MNRKTNLIALIGFAFALLIATQTTVNAQLLINEVEIDAPSTTSNACQYTEIRGVAGATVPANTYFLSVNSDGANYGFLNAAVNFGGQVVGGNTTITLFNTFSGPCGARGFGGGTTVFNYTSPLTVSGNGQGSETFLIVTSTTNLIGGQDIDTNDDGIIDPALGVTVVDGFALLVNPEEEYVYGAANGVVNISNRQFNLNQPDAVTRFFSNTTPFAANAFYYGDLASSPDDTTTYVAPFSPNFPTGGALTPGGPNVGTALATRFDYDADGRADQAVFRSGTWFVRRSTAGTVGINWGVSSDRIVPADYNGDGSFDYAVFRNGTWFILFANNSTTRTVSFGEPGDIPLPRDFTGDGVADLAVWRPSNRTWYVARPTGVPAQNFESIPFGLSTDIPVSADFDGDARADYAVFRPSTGEWFYLASSNNNAFRSVRFGQQGDVLVPADYNGDRIDDQAVYRNGTWFLNLSPNNTFATVVFGQTGDIPAPADYNGDGRADVTLFRDGTWFSLLSPGNSFATVQFGLAGDRPVPAAFNGQ